LSFSLIALLTRLLKKCLDAVIPSEARNLLLLGI